MQDSSGQCRVGEQCRIVQDRDSARQIRTVQASSAGQCRTGPVPRQFRSVQGDSVGQCRTGTVQKQFEQCRTMQGGEGGIVPGSAGQGQYRTVRNVQDSIVGQCKNRAG